MKSLDEMIKELCPDGVEFVKLGEVCKSLSKGTLKATDLVEQGEFPVINSGRELYGYYNQCNNEGNAITVAARGEYAGFITYMKTPFWAGGLCYPYRTIDENLLITKFLFYFLKTEERKNMDKLVVRGSIPALNKSSFDKIEIPLPPIEVQTEIVRILDKFTSLETELETELDCRKRQYEYYRDKLLSFDNVGGQNVEWKKMSEVAFYPKTRIDSTELTENSYIGVENLLKDKQGRTNSTTIPTGSVIQFLEKDILVGNIRPYLRKIWKSDCEGGTNGDVLCIRVKDCSEISADFLFHILASETFFLYDIKNSKGAKMPRGNKAAVMDFKLPIPSLAEQRRIVSILDRFESLTTSLQSGLPAEISARRQQYEYYRDKLLTFKRKTA